MVVVLPRHHPLRGAEDMTLLQYALRGLQAFIGFGRGAARREFGQLGLDMNESRERFVECVGIIRNALSKEAFTHYGDFYKLGASPCGRRPTTDRRSPTTRTFLGESDLGADRAASRPQASHHLAKALRRVPQGPVRV